MIDKNNIVKFMYLLFTFMIYMVVLRSKLEASIVWSSVLTRFITWNMVFVFNYTQALEEACFIESCAIRATFTYDALINLTPWLPVSCLQIPHDMLIFPKCGFS